MVERRNQEKVVLVGQIMMAVLDDAGKFQVFMGQEDGFWIPRGTGREVQPCLVVKVKWDIGVF